MNTDKQQEIACLAAELFEAVGETASWTRPLQRIAQLIGARGVGLDALDKDFVCNTRIASIPDAEPSLCRTLDARSLHCFIDERRPGAVVRIPLTDTTKSTNGEIAPRAASDSPLQSCALLAPIPGRGSWQAYLTLFFDTLGDDEEIAAGRFLQAVMPGLARALEIHSRLHGLDRSRELHAACLDRWSSGIVVTDENLRILLTNRVADDVMVEGHTIRCLNGHIRFVNADDCRRFAALRARLRVTPGESASMLLGTRTGERYRYSLHVEQRAADPGRHAPAMLCMSVTRLEEAIATRHIQRLRDLFGLSCAEARLAVAMLRGTALKVAARQRGISYESARFTLRQIYAKVGVNKQGALVALLAQAMAGFD